RAFVRPVVSTFLAGIAREASAHVLRAGASWRGSRSKTPLTDSSLRRAVPGDESLKSFSKRRAGRETELGGRTGDVGARLADVAGLFGELLDLRRFAEGVCDRC